MQQDNVERIHEATDSIHEFLSGLQRELDHSVAAAARAAGEWGPAYAALEGEARARATAFLDDAYALITGLDAPLSADERARCRAYHRLRVQPFFLGCPFVRWSVDKPFGYPGDFNIVEMLFDNRADGLSPLARVLSSYALNCGTTRAHRARAGWVHEILRSLTARADAPLDVLSFACGPERVMREFFAQGGRCNLVLSDFDRRALDYAEKKIDDVVKARGEPIRVRSVELSAYRLVKDKTSLERLTKASAQGSFDAVLVLGLLDYLDDRSLTAFLDTLAGALAPGGMILLTNLHAENPWRSFMDYVGHWEVIHRTKADFERLAVGDGRFGLIEHRTDETGTNLFFLGRRER